MSNLQHSVPVIGLMQAVSRYHGTTNSLLINNQTHGFASVVLDGRWLSDKLYKRESVTWSAAPHSLPVKYSLPFFVTVCPRLWNGFRALFPFTHGAWLSPCKLQITDSSSCEDRRGCVWKYSPCVAYSYLVIHPFAEEPASVFVRRQNDSQWYTVMWSIGFVGVD